MAKSRIKRVVIQQATREFAEKLSDEGKLIEAGFALFAHFAIAKDAPAVQLREMRLAYMAGAEHLFSSIMNILEEGEEPTEADLRRMSLINKEIELWRGTLSERISPSQGRA